MKNVRHPLKLWRKALLAVYFLGIMLNNLSKIRAIGGVRRLGEY